MEARTGESGLRRGQEKESAGANCTARWAVHRGAPLKAQVPSPQPKKTHRIERWVFFCSFCILTGLEGGGANGRERFAKGAGKRKRGSKLHSPVGCAPGRAAKGASPVTSTKKTHRIERWVFFCSFCILTGLEGGGANGRERFAKGAGKRKRGSKLHSPVGCAPGRAAKGASPVTSTKKNTPLYARVFMEIILLYVSLFIRRIVIRSS